MFIKSLLYNDDNTLNYKFLLNSICDTIFLISSISVIICTYNLTYGLKKKEKRNPVDNTHFKSRNVSSNENKD